MNFEQIRTKKECSEVSVKLLDTGIIHVYFNDDTTVTKHTIDWILAASLEICTEKKPFLYEAGEFISNTKGAVKRAKEVNSEMPVIAKAIVVKNLAHRLLANYHYRTFKQLFPTQVFKSKEEAQSWLLSFIKTEELT